MKEIAIKSYNNNAKKFILNNKRLLISISLYAFGLILGIILKLKVLKDIEISDPFSTIDKDIKEIILINSLKNVILVFLCCILGTCIFGYLIIDLPIIFYGMISSLIISNYYYLYNIKGIGYSSLIIIPESSIILLILLYVIKTAGDTSEILFRKSKNIKVEREISIKDYAIKTIEFVMIALIISVINSLIIYSLSSLISI